MKQASSLKAGALKAIKAKAKAKKPRSREGQAEAKAAAKMTSEEWKKLQEGMAEKWPQPEYMAVEAPGKHGTIYRDETFSVVTRWSADTKIAYRPHAKSPGSKSHVRYEAYSKARTVGEALKMGTYPQDWCWDYERGFIRVIGPVREEPLDLSKVMDDNELTDVDVAINTWIRRELAKKLGLDYKDLNVGKGSGESTLMRANRLVAQREAKKRLEAADREKRKITDKEVELTMKEWGFGRNVSRVNVMPKDQEWVWSDTLGLLIDRTGDIHLTPATAMYPAVTMIIARWLRDRLPPEIADFGYTSLNLNCNYAARLHRDGNNFGPSLIKAFGDFTGGELNYWPEDDKSSKVEALPKAKAVQFQIRDGLAMFNGNCGHSVEPFEGERFSIVYFTSGCHARAPPEIRAALEGLGITPPPAEQDRFKLLRAPRGYEKGAAAAAKAALPAQRFWTSKKLESQRFVHRPLKVPKEVAWKPLRQTRNAKAKAKAKGAKSAARPVKEVKKAALKPRKIAAAGA